ncbi:flagellar protein export ATPase FliI [Calorimonas adulescens]|jgi:type III secretion system ATPase, FliI/YscN (EC 3.6.3.15)|uniref:Flagellar protein export ATPase FliI n=1 Tax=Calorimonas adulescens TaxID=2606906 RepID=A0A5D8QFN5_9THEO|nr:flagellar protein export ATPase FliI [Calorimonas adulescens]TZE83355.1 flagellar protein export ATPase FliI [Calorimonas adulescens]
MVNLDKYFTAVETTPFYTIKGVTKDVIGLTIVSQGPSAKVGDVCDVFSLNGERAIPAEVVGFKDGNTILMPLGEMDGIGPGSEVIARNLPLTVGVSEKMLGRILDGLGRPIDGNGDIYYTDYYPIQNHAPRPLERERINKPLTVGIKAIDGLLTVGKGQRIGIFAGSGVGKSTLLGMMARNTKADINVIALIGERGREVKDFIERDLGEDGLKRSVLVVATSDEPALIRVKGAYVATAIAEYFRDMGFDVLFMMDSVTRFAMAQREVGLAIGEPPVSRGYTPSVFSNLPKLLERAGNLKRGSITGFYTVLVDGDDLNEPVTDACRSILDGHIVLSRQLANQNHYPAIDVLASVSRVMNDIVTDEHKRIAGEIKDSMAAYKEAEDIINIGMYNAGSNKRIDRAIYLHDKIESFLRQGAEENFSFDTTFSLLKALVLE